MQNRLWVVIPAAGVGRRMASDVPKQYLSLLGRTVLEAAVAPFLQRSDIAGVVIAHAATDERVTTLALSTDPRVRLVTGGTERAETVSLGLAALHAGDSDWVLVHDAARPCLHTDDLNGLIHEVAQHEVGGLLACASSDTLKQADAQLTVERTLTREKIWRALTPQMFRYGVLQRALQSAQEKGVHVTDESSAVEALGLRPKLVQGRSDNIKVTVPEDLAYAEFILRSRHS